jgi:phage terminase large subunit
MAVTAAQIRAAERLAQVAHSAGLPQDALRNFLRAGYCPQLKQLLMHAAARECDRPGGPTRVGFGGARGPGKSHGTLAQIGLDDCQRRDGLKFLFLRKVLKSAKESFDDLRRRIFRFTPHEYKTQSGLLLFPNGSRIVLGHYRTEQDIDNYLGIEYDGVGIEEATQLAEKKITDIRTCVRTSRDDWRPRSYFTTNPGGVGHAHFKKTFILPARAGAETDTRFVFATHRDNAFLNSDYGKVLGDLKGWLRAAWMEGDWDIEAGQFFSTWRHDRLVKPWFKVPDNWRVWASLDYGFTHPTAVYLHAEADGKRYTLDEYVQRKTLVPQHAANIKAMLDRNGVSIGRLRTFVAGADVFAQRGDSEAKTIADQYKAQGITLTQANDDRINGAGTLLDLMGDADANLEPKWEISDRCARLIECLPALQHDPKNPEDVLKVDCDEEGEGGDDPYDSTRYGMMVPKPTQVGKVEWLI